MFAGTCFGALRRCGADQHQGEERVGQGKGRGSSEAFELEARFKADAEAKQRAAAVRKLLFGVEALIA